MSGQTLTTLLYGAIVNQVLEQEQDAEKTNEVLNQFGLNIGARLVDDYVSHFPNSGSDSFTGLADPVADAIGYFLDIQGNVSVQSKDEQ